MSSDKTPAYAAETVVSVEKTKAELDTLLSKHGARDYGVANNESAGVARVFFIVDARKYAIAVPLPTAPDSWWNWSTQRRTEWIDKQQAQAMRTRWRAILLLVRAKLEIINMGGSTFEREFLADLVLPNGQTAHQTIAPYMAKLIADGYSGPLALPEHKP